MSEEIIIGIVIGFVVCRLIDLHYYEGLTINMLKNE